MKERFAFRCKRQEVCCPSILPLTSYLLQLKNPSCFSTGRERIQIYPWYHLNYRIFLRSLSPLNARSTSSLLTQFAFGSLLESVIHTSSVMRFPLSRNHCERYPVLLVFVMAFILLTLYTPSHPFVKRFCGHLTKKPILQAGVCGLFG